eukprot:g12485.t1
MAGSYADVAPDPSYFACPVVEITVGVDDEVKLDCFEPWHRVSSNFRNYIYYAGSLVRPISGPLYTTLTLTLSLVRPISGPLLTTLTLTLTLSLVRPISGPLLIT